MESASKVLIIILFHVGFFATGQSTAEKLKKEQARLEGNIANTKLLLKKSKSNTVASFNELKLINNQIKYREDLMRNYDNQIRGAELKIVQKQGQTAALTSRIGTLKNQYKKLLLYAYKRRNKSGQMMYIFSSQSYFEALKRARYLEKIQDIMKKQFMMIEQNKKLISSEINEIKRERSYKEQIISEKKEEREQIALDKEKKEKLYLSFKQQEGELMAKLQKEESEKAKLKSKINDAIKADIALAEKQRKKAEAEAVKKVASAKKPSETNTESTGTEASTTAAKVELSETKEGTLAGQGFEGNKGKLPWPVQKGSIVEGFGRNEHPTLPGVFTNNNGLDISAPKNAQIRSVYDGEVSSILSIPGAGKVVIVKHGNYRTVYSNLANVYVEKGSKVTTKQVIGSLTSSDNQNTSVSHFEIHFASGSNVKSLNPALWLAK